MSGAPQELVKSLLTAHHTFLGLWPGAMEEAHCGARLVGNRLAPVPFRTHATWVRATTAQVPPLIEEATAFCEKLGAIPAFHLDPGTTPADLPAQLAAAGFRKRVDEAWMIYDPAQPGDAAANPAVTLEALHPTSASDALQAYIDCYNHNFRTPSRTWAGFGESFRGVVGHPAGLHLLARIDGAPAGAATLMTEGVYGCVYNVGAFPAFRGQGVATTLLRRLAEAAAERGATTLFLQAVHQGPAQPLYQRLGYVTRFLRGWHLPDAPGGIWS